jgi:hypothetical protein
VATDGVTLIEQDHRAMEALFALREAVDDTTLRTLGTAFERVRTDLLRESGPAAADIEETRDDLYEMAKEAHITGRSSMNEQELAEALQRADPSTR